MPIRQVVSKGKIPVKIWTDTAESGALDQAANLANLPFAFKHIALMPDTHQGFGMPIGGVLATKDVIVPSAVGVDIGCGMIAVKTSLFPAEITNSALNAVVDEIYAQIPTGFSRRTDPDRWAYRFARPHIEQAPIVVREYDRALLQLGSLGSGNHFIEIQAGSDGHVWIMLHSGSRNLGKQICDHYSKRAQELNRLWASGVPKELAFLPTATPEGTAYLHEMRYALEFAALNRAIMLRICKEIFAEIFSLGKNAFLSEINAHHNYAAYEQHFGESVWVHRKGAISAYPDEHGIIPGSMGTASYIVRGLGNEQAFCSASHGSGRVMSRSAAKQQISQERMAETMGTVVYRTTDTSESPDAYKSIEDVMAHQDDLVEPVVRLTPMAVIKGEE